MIDLLVCKEQQKKKIKQKKNLFFYSTGNLAANQIRSFCLCDNFENEFVAMDTS